MPTLLKTSSKSILNETHRIIYEHQRITTKAGRERVQKGDWTGPVWSYTNYSLRLRYSEEAGKLDGYAEAIPFERA